MRGTIWLIAMALYAVGPTAAEAAGCNEQSNQMQLDICADQDFKAADKILNETYGEIVNRLVDNPDARKQLVEAQKAWIGFRDAECKFQSINSVRGSIYPMLVSECWTSMTNNRIEELKVYLECDEGDTLCPVPAP